MKLDKQCRNMKMRGCLKEPLGNGCSFNDLRQLILPLWALCMKLEIILNFL